MKIFFDTNVVIEHLMRRERFDDLEDSCQLQAAASAGCQCLLTFNAKDYPTDDNQIKVMTPEQFLVENPLKS